jgi:hypothetical protein
METITIAVSTIPQKTDRKEYMRNYKRKEYAEKGEEIRAKNKAYYCKYKNNVPAEQMKKYGIHLPKVVAIQKSLADLYNADPDLFNDIIANLSAELPAFISKNT